MAEGSEGFIDYGRSIAGQSVFRCGKLKCIEYNSEHSICNKIRISPMVFICNNFLSQNLDFRYNL